MKRKKVVYVCDICGKEFTEKIDECPVCGKDYCKECDGRITAHVSSESKVFLNATYAVCKVCSSQKTLAESIAVDLIKGKDLSQREFKVGK